MYQFAIMALLALAVVKLVDFLVDSVPTLAGFRSVLPFVFGIGSVLVLDYSLFEGYGIDIRNQDMGMILTGFMVAGMTVPWRAILGWMSQTGAGEGRDSGRKMRAA